MATSIPAIVDSLIKKRGAASVSPIEAIKHPGEIPVKFGNGRYAVDESVMVEGTLYTFNFEGRRTGIVKVGGKLETYDLV